MATARLVVKEGRRAGLAVVAGALFRFEAVVVEGDGGVRILDEVSLDIPDSGVTVLTGPSGSGKSTLLRLCNRLEVPTAGAVRYRGVDVTEGNPLAHRRRVGMVFQRPALFAGTVADNLAVACPDGDGGRYGAALERADLDRSFLTRTGDELSGGEAQRACLARTLITDPEVLLLDEPTSSLDPASTRVLERLVRAEADGGVPVLWVSHDLDQVRRLADHRVVLIGGRVADASAAANYLGDDSGEGRSHG